ncbi:YHS domain-containing protein [Geotalea sp. SG265]|uniref:YHS domain-containing protein n=1 Tax=Geotalea sp. SG265 TaxID=2922867 RepID=UPI001FB04125|nr:YHS domain-containing protein [Geotalea sp. SG265]
MAKLLVLILVGYAIYRMFKGRPELKEVHRDADREEETFRDPVCGTYVTREDAVIGNLEGRKLHFCSMSCLEKFREQLETAEKNSIGGEK